MELGLKAALYQTKDSSFSFSIVGHVGVPKLTSDSHAAEKVFYRTRLLFENELTNKIKVNSNIGYFKVRLY